MALNRRGSLADLAADIQKVSSSKAQQFVTDSGIVFPTGSTMANLALADSPFGGYPAGTIVNIVGDSSAGKSMMLWTLFAEIARSSQFQDYDLFFDDAEAANSFDIDKLFGDISDRVVLIDPPSETIEDWYRNVLMCTKSEKPFIYGLDSFDAIGSKAEQSRAEELIKSGEMAGTFGGEKPKLASEMLRNIVSKIKKTGSLVFIISQTRDKIGAMAFQKKSTKSGGRAMKFYAHQEIWLSVTGSIAKEVRGKKREIGVDVQFNVEKNKKTGKRRKVTFPILYDYGIDDLESSISWLVAEKFWGSTSAGLKVEGLSGVLSSLNGNIRKAELISRIEELEGEDDLKEYVAKCWFEIEEALRGKRKPKYHIGD
jgi:RecA/RadA recombinase